MHPLLFHLHLGGVTHPIYAYGLFIVLGITDGLILTIARARRFGIPRFDALACGLCGVSGGVFGGSLLSAALHWREFAAQPALLTQPGLVFYGGFLGGVAGAWAYCRAYDLRLLDVADAGAPGLAFGHAIGRIGCFLGGCCYGRPVAPSFPLAAHMAGAWRQPVQLYEAAGLVVLSLVLASLPSRRPGALFALYAGGYAVLRFALEWLRGDDLERGFLIPGVLSTSQAIALVVLGAAALWLRVTRKGAAV